MINNLIYRRQFLLARDQVVELQSWNMVQIAGYYLYVHPDLNLTQQKDSKRKIILLGDIFDPTRHQLDNLGIVAGIIEKAKDLDSIILTIKPFVGRYVLLYEDANGLSILHDAFGVREVYYCLERNRVICGSQPNLLDAFSEPKLGITKDQGILDFYKNDMKHVRLGRSWVGDATIFRDVKHLIPNHYLHIESMGITRYWPNRKLEIMPLWTAVEKACEFLRGFMQAVTYRYDVMIAVTAGYDSRSLLAASRDVKDRIYYFINKEPQLTDRSPDIRIPKAMFKKINIPFHVHDVCGTVNEEFKKVYLQNVFWALERSLPTIYNVYYKNHQNRVNLLGIGELGRVYFGDAPPDLDGYFLARSLKYRESHYATIQCEKWLQEAKGISEEYNIDIMKIFLWEHLFANWCAIGNAESDIAIEEIDPYSSHYINEILLSYDKRQGGIYEAMYNHMWPELLSFQLNPPDNISERIKEWMKNIGLFLPIQRNLYRYERWKYRKKVKSTVIGNKA